MLYGVSINGVDTLAEFGLILCADLTIGEPKLKSNYVDIPGGNGSLNLSYSPQGYAVFEDRTISFTLFKPMEEAERGELVDVLRNRWHGNEVDLILPNDTTHYWHGVIQFGGIRGYNTGEIPTTMRAEPYKKKKTETVKSKTGAGTIILTNERMPVVPFVSSNGSAVLAWENNSAAISAGANQRIPQLVLGPGATQITITGTATVSFRYREGSL